MKTTARILVRALLPLLVALPGWAQDKPQPTTAEAAITAFWWGDFAELERQNALYQQPGQIQPDGVPRLERFRVGLSRVFEYKVKNAESYSAELDALTLQWAQAHPKSAFAHILHAEALFHHAWSYRGNGVAGDVSPEAWKGFYAYLERASAYLRLHGDLVLADTSAHSLLLNIGRAMGWDNKQQFAILQDGLKRKPEDLALYRTVLLGLLPKWGGNAKDLDDFIRKATEETKARHGMAMYAILYSEAGENQYNHALFEDSLADWDKVRQGYDDLFARYPDSPKRLNRYAYLACLAKDKPTFLKVYGQVGSKAELSEWGVNPERNLEACKRWGTQV